VTASGYAGAIFSCVRRIWTGETELFRKRTVRALSALLAVGAPPGETRTSHMRAVS
jgi:hypothetical protein